MLVADMGSQGFLHWWHGDPLVMTYFLRNDSYGRRGRSLQFPDVCSPQHSILIGDLNNWCLTPETIAGLLWRISSRVAYLSGSVILVSRSCRFGVAPLQTTVSLTWSFRGTQLVLTVVAFLGCQADRLASKLKFMRCLIEIIIRVLLSA